MPVLKMYQFPISPSFLARIREIYPSPEYYDPADYRFVSRYSNVRRILDSESSKLYHETVNKQEIPETSDDLYCTVDNTSVNRLDIISNQYYDTPLYWWVLAIANNIIDPFDIKLGTVLRIPPLTSLYVNGGILSNG